MTGDPVGKEARSEQIAQIYQVFHDLSRYFVSQWMQEENESISPKQFILMRTLHEKGKCTVSELAAELGLSTSATTIALNRLVKQGFVDRIRSDDDRRVVWVELSTKVVPRIQQLKEKRKEMFSAFLQSLTDEELGQFKHCLTKIKDFIP